MTKRHWNEGKKTETDFNTLAAKMRAQVAENKTKETKIVRLEVDKMDEFRERIRLLRERLNELSSRPWTIS